MITATALDRRVLFLAATAKDGETTAAVLSPLGIAVQVCTTFEVLLREIAAGAGAVMLPEEAGTSQHNASLRRALASQPQWSDLPVLVLTRPGADSAEAGDAVKMLGNVTLLERPLRVATLVSVVRTALRARERQYQIREHLAERARAEQTLRLADHRKDEFLATLGHELRNPLAPLLTALQLLRTSGVQDPAVIRVSGVMERQITHLVRLVNDLLEVSRITRGLIHVDRAAVDLMSIMNAAVETSRPAVDASHHQLTVDTCAEPLTVNGDAVRLTQVFANLVTNAAKYTMERGRIHVRLRADGGRAVVSVSDNGIGIAPDQLTSVFEMFTQLDRSNRLGQGGLGIGLTLVRSLVEMHGGTVTAHSDGVGKGSEFTVSLPLATAAAAAHTSKRALPQRLPPRRVLIVDDNHDAADTLGELLTSLGATVQVAHSGHAALDMLDTFEPEAILLDIGMPELDGYDVARAIRSNKRHANLLIIALTGWGQAEDERRSRAAGFDHHIVKPPDIARLHDLLADSADHWQARPPRPSTVP